MSNQQKLCLIGVLVLGAVVWLILDMRSATTDEDRMLSGMGYSDMSKKLLSFFASDNSTLVQCEYVYSANANTTAFFRSLNLSSRGRRRISSLTAWLKPEAGKSYRVSYPFLLITYTARFGEAPQEIPLVLRNGYTLDGQIPVSKHYFNEAYLGGKALSSVWTMDMIQKLRQRVRNREMIFNYDSSCIYYALDAHRALVEGKSGLVIGSETPWAESMLLEYGATAIATLEFGSIDSQHPAITSWTPVNFTVSFLEGKISQFDFAFSFSSLEHDGLGRYGDILNPDGDLQTMTRLLDVVKPGGFMFLGVPCCDGDHLYWNAHRVYGSLRLPLMLAGWHPLGLYYSRFRLGLAATPAEHIEQPVIVLQNTRGCANLPFEYI